MGLRGACTTGLTARSKRSQASELNSICLLFSEVFAMPQPLPHGKPINFDFRQDACLERPNLTRYIVAICMSWNEIESRLGIFLAALMGGEAKTIVSVFLALRTDGGKKATLDTVAELKLSPDDLKEFQDIQDEIAKRYKDRNKAVHGAWGISPEYPDDLLWYDHRETIAMFPDLMLRLSSSAARTKLLDEQRKSIRVYTEQDLVDINSRIQTTSKKLETFTARWVGPLFERMKV